MTIERLAATALISGAMLTAACTEMVNPFRDDLPGATMITTPSAYRVEQLDVQSELRQRDWAPSLVESQTQGVAHWPLWFSDRLEDSGSNDGQFAWTWLDYAAVVYGPARQSANVLGTPVSAVVFPPWQTRCSDGLMAPSFGFGSEDPVDCGGVPIPPDIIEAYNEVPNLPQPGDSDESPEE